MVRTMIIRFATSLRSELTEGGFPMRVKCVICDNVGQLPDDLPLAKTLRNRPIHTYMCQECNNRIAEKTIARIATGNFIFYRSSQSIEKDF